MINPLNAELNPICHLLAVVGAHHILHLSRIRVNYIHQLDCFNDDFNVSYHAQVAMRSVYIRS